MNLETPWTAAFENDRAIIYLTDANLRIVRCNAAWDRFALENGGAAWTRNLQTGSNLLDVLPVVLRPFYVAAFEKVRTSRQEWTHLFECSSPDVYRLFHMRVLPALDSGLLIVNSLLRTHELGSPAHAPVGDYEGDSGIVTMCSHCRRAKNLTHLERWDWVPELVQDPPRLLSHGLCQFCRHYHYPKLQAP